ncbi:MAG: DUF4398 domain-containing protein [Candidatus Deferrimicrobiaceae bacterium]
MNGCRKSIQILILIFLAKGLLLSIGCATANWPLSSTQKISVGEKAIAEAKANNAAIEAPDALKSAEEKLSLAKKEFAGGWHRDASRFAEEAAVDADYARAKATTEKDKKTVKELMENINALQQDIDRQPK